MLPIHNALSLTVPVLPLIPDTRPVADQEPVSETFAKGEAVQIASPPRGWLPPQPLGFEHSLLNAAAMQGRVPKSGPKGPVPKPPKPQPPKPQPLRPKPEAERLAPPEPPSRLVDPDEGLLKPLKLKGSSRLPDKPDEHIYQEFLTIQREVRDDLKLAGQLPDLSAHQGLILEKLLLRLGQESYQQLSDIDKQALHSFLGSLGLPELVLAEVQSEGGAEAVEGIVTGTGVDGHYTNSILRSVQGLLETGRLSPQLLQALDSLRQAPLHPALEEQRLSLLRSAMQELAFPERIEQHSKGTCAPTTVQILLAIRAPVQYLQILQALASPEGQVPPELLHGHSGMVREADTLQDDRSGRSLSSRLLQPALMEYANGDQNYDNAKDRNSDGQTEYAGLDEKGSIHLSEALFGPGSYEFRHINAQPDPAWKGFVTVTTLMQEVQESLNRGQPVPVGLRWGDSGHKILLTHLDAEEKKAYFMNPWGELQHMPLETFVKRLDSASLPKNHQMASRPALETLPGAAARKTSYQPISNWRYYKITDYLIEDPLLKNLPEERKQLLREKFRTLRLSPEFAARQMETLVSLARSELLDDRLFQRIEAVRDKDELAALVKLYSTHEKLPPDRFKDLVAAEPDKYLDTAYYQLLMENLEHPQRSDALIALARENRAMQQDGRAEERHRVQAHIREVFTALEPGGSLEALRPLLAEASEQTRLEMLKTVSEKWPPAKAETISELLLQGLNFMQMNYLLLGLEPGVRFVGLDTPDQIQRYIRSHVRAEAYRRRVTHP